MEVLASPAYHCARARHDLGGLSLGADLAQAGPLAELLAGVHLPWTTKSSAKYAKTTTR